VLSNGRRHQKCEYLPEHPAAMPITSLPNTTQSYFNANLGPQTPLLYYTPAPIPTTFLTLQQGLLTFLQQGSNNPLQHGQFVQLPLQDSIDQNRLFPIPLHSFNPGATAQGKTTYSSLPPEDQTQQNGPNKIGPRVSKTSNNKKTTITNNRQIP
jgi:hypothetical protein